MQEKLSKNDLGPRFQEAVTTQEYSKKPVIEGVKVIDLRLMTDDGGAFAEMVRFDEEGRLVPIPDFKVRQASYSHIMPGAIKAFHMHYNQEDVWFVPPTDNLLVGMVDARANSPSYEVTMRLVLGGGKAQLLYIPRGVAHGLRQHRGAPRDNPVFCEPALQHRRPGRAAAALGHPRGRVLADDAGLGGSGGAVRSGRGAVSHGAE